MCERTQKEETHEQLAEVWERAREMIRNEGKGYGVRSTLFTG
jgi:hypothetical protein